LPGSGDSAVELDDIISLPKTGSVKAISRFIALRGIVTRRQLREMFRSGSTRTTITHLKKLGLIYSRPGKNGFVVSLPWLLYLSEIRADWKSIVKAEVPDVSEKELSELEEALREAKRGPLGILIKHLIKISRYENFYEEQLGNVMNVLSENCMRPAFKQQDILNRVIKYCCHNNHRDSYAGYQNSSRRCEECVHSLLEHVSEMYYQECLRPLLQYAWWLLTLIPAIAGYLYRQPSKERIRELAEELTEQAKDLARDIPSVAWEARLYSKTMYTIAKLLRELEKQDITYPSGAETLFEYYKRIMKNIRDTDRYNKNTVLRPFIKATIAKLLTSPQSPTK